MKNLTKPLMKQRKVGQIRKMKNILYVIIFQQPLADSSPIGLVVKVVCDLQTVQYIHKQIGDGILPKPVMTTEKEKGVL